MGKKVLLALMQLDIGGAETHVVELAKELARRGYHVTVASNGGSYERELQAASIRHVSIPLHTKKPTCLIKSYFALRKLIRTERFDVVHSHARIPSFVLGLLRKTVRFPFVTTAHWVFDTSHGLKYLTDWGERTLAVSEDIKTYLTDNYGIPADHILVTVNGIDTEKFSPDTDDTAVRERFEIPSDAPVIVYVSRMDTDRSLVAHQLIDQMPTLCEKIDGLHTILIGGGNDYDAVRAEAEAANAALGRTAVHLAGASTEIAALVSPADLFVGVSRAALEAMAAGKPTVIAGNEGYIGLFGADKEPICFSTNFCCRGCPPSNGETLSDDILAFFAKSADEKAALADYGRTFIRSNYSVDRMADDTEALYRAALSLYPDADTDCRKE